MGDWGKRIKITFQSAGGGDEVYSIVSSELITKFRLKEVNYNTYIYPTSVTAGENANEIYLNFSDINQAQPPNVIEYLGGGSIRGQDLTIDPFSMPITLLNLGRQGTREYLKIDTLEMNGTVVLLSFETGYHKEYLKIDTLEMNGTIALCDFDVGYNTEALELSSATMNGTYCDADGVPI